MRQVLQHSPADKNIADDAVRDLYRRRHAFCDMSQTARRATSNAGTWEDGSFTVPRPRRGPLQGRFWRSSSSAAPASTQETLSAQADIAERCGVRHTGAFLRGLICCGRRWPCKSGSPCLPCICRSRSVGGVRGDEGRGLATPALLSPFGGRCVGH